jgi:hypothetical protein
MTLSKSIIFSALLLLPLLLDLCLAMKPLHKGTAPLLLAAVTALAAPRIIVFCCRTAAKCSAINACLPMPRLDTFASSVKG